MSEPTITESALRAANVPYLDQYFGVWACHIPTLHAMHGRAMQMDVTAHLRDVATRRAVEPKSMEDDDKKAPPPSRESRIGLAEARGEMTTEYVKHGYSYTVVDGVAIVTAEGTLMKHASSFDESTSTVMLRNTVRKMTTNPSVRAAILVISSPGGTVAGAYDLADDVAALAKAKPTYAYVADLGASAAYLLASQCRAISANRNAIVGSIGTYGVVWDMSKMFEDAGVTVHVIKGRVGEDRQESPYKGAGEPGTKITEEQLGAWQAQIDALNDQFIKAVTSGRKVEQTKVEGWADGNAHVAAKAKSLGLIDKVESLDQLFARVRQEAGVAGPNAGPAKLDAGMESNPPQINHDAGGSAAGETSTQAAPVPGPEGDTMSQSNTAPAAGTQQAGQQATAPVPAPQQPAQSGQVAQGEQGGPRPATIAELEEKFAGEDKFVLQAAKNGWTLTEANSAFAVITADRATRPATDAKRPGVPALESASAEKPRTGARDPMGAGDAHEELESRATQLVESRPGMSRAEAKRRVLADDDSLRDRYVQEQNAASVSRVGDRIHERMAIRR